MSFFSEYFKLNNSVGEVAVCCPFPHHTPTGLTYTETNPSASVNLSEGVFYCQVCKQGFSESQFIEQVLKTDYVGAVKIQQAFKAGLLRDSIKPDLVLTQGSYLKAKEYNISDDVIEELDMHTPTNGTDELCFPVFMFDTLLDNRTYKQGEKPKVKSLAQAPSGLIIPFDIWNDSPLNKVTILCAGEKDMAVTRSQGLNAICLTGGEGAIPKQLSYFKDRVVAICYDNDAAGINGAKSVATAIQSYAKLVKVITGFHEVCKESGEDLTDFFNKYNKTKADLVSYIKNTPAYVSTPEEHIKVRPKVSLLEATDTKYANKILQSNIQVVAVSDSAFVLPTSVYAEKFKIDGGKDTMYDGEIREWELGDDNLQDILHLIDNNFKETDIKGNLKRLMKIPLTERCVKLKTVTKRSTFKVYVTDMFETSDNSVQAMEYTAYCIGLKLESGKKYLVDYKLVPHPYKGQQYVMIITNVSQANDSVSNFIVTEEVKHNLKTIQELGDTVETKVNKLTECVKGLLGYNGNNTLIQVLDLSYHTVLAFNFGAFKNVRGYLDTFVVGESRVGKSSTAEALRQEYGLGVFASLAGNSATVSGLIGGSNKNANGFQTRAGLIPQNHKGLIIFEEFGKCNTNLSKELTDIRSSNEVRITRVAGTITLPASVRMITLTNVKTFDGEIKSIASYPNGISIVTELVGTAEDIARYDILCVLSDRGSEQTDPFWKPEEPLPTECYKDRVRWVWSRTAEQVLISDDVGRYIVEQANDLNKKYSCHIKIFGTEAWKKVSRLAIAIAAYTVSTDESYNNIIVTKDCVDYAVKLYETLYNNSTFKLKEYVTHERKYSEKTPEAVSNLQSIYNASPSLILHLEQCSKTSKNMLQAASGQSNDDINKMLNRLAKGLFIRFNNHDIIPTERFRLCLADMNRSGVVPRNGE